MNPGAARGGDGFSADGPESVTLESVLIDRVVDTAISAYGVKLTVTTSAIQNTRPERETGRALGIDLGASARFEGKKPSERTPGELYMKLSTIDTQRRDPFRSVCDRGCVARSAPESHRRLAARNLHAEFPRQLSG